MCDPRLSFSRISPGEKDQLPRPLTRGFLVFLTVLRELKTSKQRTKRINKQTNKQKGRRESGFRLGNIVVTVIIVSVTAYTTVVIILSTGFETRFSCPL